MSIPLNTVSIRVLTYASCLAKAAPSSVVGTFVVVSMDIVVELEVFDEQAAVHKIRPTMQHSSLGLSI